MFEQPTTDRDRQLGVVRRLDDELCLRAAVEFSKLVEREEEQEKIKIVQNK